MVRRAAMAVAILAIALSAGTAGGQDAPPGLDERFTEPAGWRWGTFDVADIGRLRYGVLPAQNPDGGAAAGTIVLGPGFTEFAERYFEVARDIHAWGYDLWIIDWPSQGGSVRPLDNPQKVYVASFDVYLTALRQFMAEIVEPAPGRPLVYFGHSMGGNIGLRYLAAHPTAFDAAVLNAPAVALRTDDRPGWMIRAWAWLADSFGGSEAYIPGAADWTEAKLADDGWQRGTSDPERGRLYGLYYRHVPQLRTGGATFGWLRAYIASIDVLWDDGVLAGIDRPILMGIPTDDRFVPVAPMRTACRTLPRCTPVEFAGGRHETWIERDEFRDRWQAAVRAFVDGSGGPT